MKGTRAVRGHGRLGADAAAHGARGRKTRNVWRGEGRSGVNQLPKDRDIVADKTVVPEKAIIPEDGRRAGAANNGSGGADGGGTADRGPESAAGGADAADARVSDGDALGAPVLSVDLDALRRNYRALATVAQGARCAAVIKANGYGLGLNEVFHALHEEGCDTFFVATLAEAQALRLLDDGITIYVLNGLAPGTAEHFQRHDLQPVLNSLPEVEEWAHYCADQRTALPAALHLDTGMLRLGLEPADVDILINYPVIFEAFQLTLVMSHLAAGDTPEHDKNEAQRALFDELRQKLPEAPASLANSAGVLMGPRFHYDMVRPGIALYGGRALARGDNPMKSVVSLMAPILQVRVARAGETVGYGCTYTLKRDSLLATVPVGYADGYFRQLGGSDERAGMLACIEGKVVPVAGRVSMDLITLDVTDIPEPLIQRGSMVELLGPNISVDDMAERAGTISYEVLTRLGSRFVRTYRR